MGMGLELVGKLEWSEREMPVKLRRWKGETEATLDKFTLSCSGSDGCLLMSMPMIMGCTCRPGSYYFYIFF